MWILKNLMTFAEVESFGLKKKVSFGKQKLICVCFLFYKKLSVFHVGSLLCPFSFAECFFLFEKNFMTSFLLCERSQADF